MSIINEVNGKREAILTNVECVINGSGMSYQCGKQSHVPENKLDFKGQHKEHHNTVVTKI